MAEEALAVASRTKDPGVQREMILMAARYMAMAERARAAAAGMNDRDTRETVIRIAEAYERLAQHADRVADRKRDRLARRKLRPFYFWYRLVILCRHASLMGAQCIHR